MSKKELAKAQGRLEGIQASGWECGDCGNMYDSHVDCCPNELLDRALLEVRRLERAVTSADASSTSSDQHPDKRSAAKVRRNHPPECPCTAGSCCPWMGECTCQCICDIIQTVEARVRDEYAKDDN